MEVTCQKFRTSILRWSEYYWAASAGDFHILTGESQSFAEVFSWFDERKLNLPQIIRSVFNKPWATVNKVINVDVTKKKQFHNFLQSFRSKLLSSNEWNYFLPNDINKFRLVKLVVSFLKSEDCAVRNKPCFSNRWFIIRETFHGICIVNEDLSST